jgi:hypothetical protein
LVERGPEKAGVGGSIPSLATNTFNNLQIAKNIQISSRVQYAYIELLIFHFWRRSLKKTVVNQFWPLTGLLEIIEPLINDMPVLDGSYKLPNGQRALPFEMVEVRKETGRDDS